MESKTFEIGVFGRVSSGKSSLLDYLLETDALPIGVTPVTAIPTRVSYGEKALARIEFAQAQARIVDLFGLAAYATEQQNPGNDKHVARIEVKLPTRRLREGVVFVDTPGLGSLAVSGAEETAAYLPRCDLGIVLVDASAGLTTEDLHVVQALYLAGATAMVLLSKADLFKREDRERMLAYVSKHLGEQIRVAPSIHAVSTVGADAVLCDRWWEEAMKPRMEKHRELAMAALRRKIDGLRGSVIAALKLRLRSDSTALSGSALSGDHGRALLDAECAIDLERRRAYDLSHAIEECFLEIVTALAGKLAHAWTVSREVDVAPLASAMFGEVLVEPISAFPRRYEELRGKLAQTLHDTSGSSLESAMSDLPGAAELPVLDASGITGKLVLERPKLLTLFGEGALKHHLRGEIERQIATALRAFLYDHGRRLRDWLERALKELKTAFDAAADVQRAKIAPVNGDGATNRGAMQQDLALLENWRSQMPDQEGLRTPERIQTGNGVYPPASREADPRMTASASLSKKRTA